MSTLQIRIDEKTKKSAARVLSRIGMDMSSAIKLYLHQITIRKGIPFRIVTENGLTIREEAEILQAMREAKQGKNVVRVTSRKEMKTYLDSLKSKK